ncbi:MAG: acyl-CoA dehydrogenase, partial [Ottowia sp.]|nr:acyl-CoA dehydrogenase [Ottowia sp.]
MNLRSTLDFLLHDWLNAGALTQRPRFAEHSRETFDAVMDTCERIARDKYAPFNRLVDTEEPRTEQEPDGSLRVVLPRATHEARAAYAESGMLAAAQDYEHGGMQLPYLVEAAANAFFGKASISIGSNLLTVGNANLLMAHGTPAQQQVFAANEFSGRWAGTMCLSEPQAGSSLSDIATRAVLEDADDPL